MTSEDTPPEAEPAPTAEPKSIAEAATPFLDKLALVIGAISPVVAYLGNLGFAPILSFAGLLCFPFLARSRRPSIATALLLALLAWGLATTGWSLVTPTDFHKYALVEHLTSLKLVLQLPAYAALVVVMQEISSGGARRALRVLAISLVAIAVVTVVESVLRGQVYLWIKAAAGQPTRPDLAARNVARAGYALALLFWPAALVLWRGRAGKAAVLLLGAGQLTAAALLRTDAVVAADIVGAAIFVMIRYGGRIGVWACIAGTTIYLAFAPLVVDLFARQPVALQVAEGGKLSWVARLQIWRTVSGLIDQKPFLGWGLDASRVLPGVPLHPHDAALQLWVELGLVGVALAAVFWAYLLSRIDRYVDADRDLAAAAGGSAGAYLTIGALSFGIWQEWWLALGALAIMVVVLLARSRGFAFVAPPPPQDEAEAAMA